MRTGALVLAGAFVALQALSLGPLREGFWGTHLLAFYPGAVAAGTWAAIAAGAYVLLFRARSLPERTIPRSLGGVRGAVVLAVLATGIFWLFRSRQTLLGDADPILTSLPAGSPFHPREPLAVWVQQAWYELWAPKLLAHGHDVRETAFLLAGALNTLFGFGFVLCAVALAREITEETVDPWIRGFTLAVLLTQGYVILFFGYVENYSIHALALGAYLWLSLRMLRGRGSFLPIAVLFPFAIGAHLSTLALLPSFLFLAWVGARRKATRHRTIAGLAVFALLLVVLDGVFRRSSPGIGLWDGVAAMARTASGAGGTDRGLAYLASPRHLRDFFSCQILMGPLASVLFVAALGLTLSLRRARAAFADPAAWFLLAAAIPLLTGSFAMSDPLLGYARDWDLFASAGVVYTTAGVWFVLRAPAPAAARARLLAFGALVSLLHLASWVGANASEARALERFATLPLGHGRTGVTVGRVYLDRGDYAQAERWLRRALVENPEHPLAHSFLGMVYESTGRPVEAGEAYARAVEIRPDKIELRVLFARSLLASGRLEEAVPELEWVLEREPGSVQHLDALATALEGLARTDEANAVRERLLAVFDARCGEAPSSAACVDRGVVLTRLGRHEEALEAYRVVLARDPRSEVALFNAGLLLVQLGRVAEAQAALVGLVRWHPQHAETEWIRRVLASPPAENDR